jgi:hypothetical protein
MGEQECKCRENVRDKVRDLETPFGSPNSDFVFGDELDSDKSGPQIATQFFVL